MEEIRDAVQIMRIGIDGIELAVRLGHGGIGTLKSLVRFLSDQLEAEKLSGKQSLKKMLIRGGNLEVLSIEKEDRKAFWKLAKKYGISYSEVINKEEKDKVDILFPTESLSRMNLILEKLRGTITPLEEYVESQKDPPTENVVKSDPEVVLSWLERRVSEDKDFAAQMASSELNIPLEEVEGIYALMSDAGLIKEDSNGRYHMNMNKEKFSGKLRELRRLSGQAWMIDKGSDQRLYPVTIGSNQIVEKGMTEYLVKMPGTKGKDQRYLKIPASETMELSRGKRILTFLDPEKEYRILDLEKKEAERMSGEKMKEKYFQKKPKPQRKPLKMNKERRRSL